MNNANISSRLCALCEKIIPDTWIVCKEHFPDYVQFKDEEWFQMLVMTQRRQFEVDNLEKIMISGKITKPYQKLTESEKRAIKFLRSKKLGARSISKVLGINIKTIKNYIYPKTDKRTHES